MQMICLTVQQISCRALQGQMNDKYSQRLERLLSLSRPKEYQEHDYVAFNFNGYLVFITLMH